MGKTSENTNIWDLRKKGSQRVRQMKETEEQIYEGLEAS